MTSIKLYEGNCLDVLRKCPDNYMDSIVTDPPYGLSFMGKGWDYSVPSTEIWKECLRVLKPGGHLLAFGGTRTYHRLVVNIEDAGFEIRDQIMWIYGSGFPKSMDISKAIDKEAGATREVIGRRNFAKAKTQHGYANDGVSRSGGDLPAEGDVTLPATDDAKKWSGYGTALKPANEPICLARKPLSEKTVAKNVLKHGVGGLNVDASRIGEQANGRFPANVILGHSTECTNRVVAQVSWFDLGNEQGIAVDQEGREIYIESSAMTEHLPKKGDYVSLLTKSDPKDRLSGIDVRPCDVEGCLDGCAIAELDKQSLAGGMHGAGKARPKQLHKGSFGIGEHGTAEYMSDHRFDDGGKTGASRFFYVAKASKKDRGEGNTHPTVKPIKLMEYLVKLVTPEGGIVLDPFMGSGTTGVACQNLGFGFRGIEMTPEYYEICKARILGAAKEAV